MKKVRKSTRSFQSGVFLGELREAIHMVTRPAQGLRKAISSYSSAAKNAVRRARNTAEASRAVSGTWLEHGFGWRPFFQDIDNGMRALANIPRIIGEPISGYAEETSKTSPFSTGESLINANLVTSWTNVIRVAVRYKGLVAYENDSTAPDFKSNWGLTLGDFIPTVWELIPYSFLVDYFTNIGDVLDTSGMGIVSLRWGFCSTRKYGIRRLISYKWVNAGWPALNHWVPGTINLPRKDLTNFSFTRTRVSGVSVGVTDFDVKVPGVRNWRQWANIGALALERSASAVLRNVRP
jgi:hypothetical protein